MVDKLVARDGRVVSFFARFVFQPFALFCFITAATGVHAQATVPDWLVNLDQIITEDVVDPDTGDVTQVTTDFNEVPAGSIAKFRVRVTNDGVDSASGTSVFFNVPPTSNLVLPFEGDITDCRIVS
ncbi:MAG: hypothetical protein AAGF56_01730, partial [Pseudomonadota bacterium]